MLAGLSPVVGDLLQRSEQVVVVIAEDIGPRQDLDVRQRLQRSEHLGMPGLVPRADQQAAADQDVALAQDDARPGFACGAGGCEARCARADDEDVAMRMHRLVMVRVGFGRGAAEAGGPADQRLVEFLPETLRPHEGLVVEAGRERLAGQRVERHHVEGERGPAVLAAADEPVVQLDLGRLAVRLAPRALAQFDQRVRLVGTGGHDPARPVVFEAAADQAHAIGQQGRGERIARMAGELTPVEAEADGFAAVDQAAAGKASRGHGVASGSASAGPAEAATAWVSVLRRTFSHCRQPA